MLQPAIYTKNQSEITLSVWKGWLYKRLLVLPYLTLGLAELNVGRSVPHIHPNESVIHLITEGRGHIETESSRYPFELGAIFCTHQDQTHVFDCDSPCIILTVRTLPTMYSYLTISQLAPNETSDGVVNTHAPNSSETTGNECRFVLSGKLRLETHDQVSILNTGTAFYIAPNTEYTLTNVDTQNASIAYTYASVADVNVYANTP